MMIPCFYRILVGYTYDRYSGYVVGVGDERVCVCDAKSGKIRFFRGEDVTIDMEKYNKMKEFER